ncbi:MAG: hypothetical protein QXU18_01000 [Thermoplasmatales archaeon]
MARPGMFRPGKERLIGKDKHMISSSPFLGFVPFPTAIVDYGNNRLEK